uniref:hypothetical protein n=1 Tax=Pandoraea pnomenusa TaxID=93220 RepID=UPI001186BBF7|nr:hypothetical protein [Pandoraea pnomenusa]
MTVLERCPMRPVLHSIGSTISEVGRSIRSTVSTAVRAIGKLAGRVTAIIRPTREIHSQHKGSEQRKIGAFRDATIEISIGTKRSSTVRETAHATDAHDEGDLASTPSNTASTDRRLTEAEGIHATDAPDKGDLASTPSNTASTDSSLAEAEGTHAPASQDKQKFTPTPFNNVFLRKQILDRVGMTSPASCANLITELARKHTDASEFKEALIASLKKTPKYSLGVNFRHLNDAQQEIVLEIFASLPTDKVDSIEMKNVVWHDCESPDTITINQKNKPLTRFLESENAIEKLSSFEMAGTYRSRGDHMHREANYDGALFDRLKGLKNLKLDLSYENFAYSGMRAKTPTILEELHLKIEYRDSVNKEFGIVGNISSFPKTRRLIMNIDPDHFLSVPRILGYQTTIDELILKQSDIDATQKLFTELFENYEVNVEIQKISESNLNIHFLDSGKNVSVKFQEFQ